MDMTQRPLKSFRVIDRNGKGDIVSIEINIFVSPREVETTKLYRPDAQDFYNESDYNAALIEFEKQAAY